jgi:hypothetical protein
MKGWPNSTSARFAWVAGTVLVGIACRPPRPASEARGADEGRTGGALVFEDTFDDDAISPQWATGYDGWVVRDGSLHVQGARNDALWLQVPLPDQFRVEFTARAESPEGDIKFEILGDGATHESGYIGIFGGWNNRLNLIARLDEHGDDRQVGADGVHVDPAHTYRMAVVRTDHRLRWYVDDALFLVYDDPHPLRGEGHRHFAFNDWTAPVVFDDVRIWDVGAR